MARNRLILSLALLCGLAGCNGRDGGALDIAIMDTADDLFTPGVRLSEGAQHVRAATSAGLVTLDARGDVMPALADRWIVTDDGLSFIFRLRDGAWPDGAPLTADSVRTALLRNIRALKGTSLGLDLEPIEEVRAMAGRVVEIRLSTPVPLLLQLLAQPELAFTLGDGGGTGDMTYTRDGSVATFAMKPPTERGVPEEEDWSEHVRPVIVHALDARAAVARFGDGSVDVVLGGRIGQLPLAETGPLSRGTVQIDPAIGLFGLHVRHARGFLAGEREREALAMAIDRPALIAPFNVAGWDSTTRVVAPGLADDAGLVAERWLDVPLEDRRMEAAGRVAAWRGSSDAPDEPVRLSIAMGSAPGDAILFRELAGQMARIGIVLERAGEEAADLVLIDRVARYAAPRWFLNQFNCRLRSGLCSEEADALVAAAGEEPVATNRQRLLAEAEARLTVANVYIPLGPPVRWSLVRGNVAGFLPNNWAFHPLPALATLPR